MVSVFIDVDKTLINDSEDFYYTINVANSGIEADPQEVKIVDFFPSIITYLLPPEISERMTVTPVSGGDEVTFDFGILDVGTAMAFPILCNFTPEAKNNDFFTNTIKIYTDGILNSEKTAKTVTLVKTETVSPREQAITDVFQSIALQETALSHILNAEGEKIQRAVKSNYSEEEILKINNSVKVMVGTVTELEKTLLSKLQLFEKVACNNCSDKTTK